MTAIKNPDEAWCERAKEFLSYDPFWGIFVWKKTASHAALAGSRAGYSRTDGYRLIELRGEAVLEHRLAWYFTHGQWPKAEIDHIDRTTANNSIDNLREATRTENNQNRATRNGCSFDKDSGKFSAEIRADGKRIYLGRFDTAKEARSAYESARRKLHPTFVSMEGQSS